MGSSVPESFPYTMALTMPLLLLAAALSSANTGVEYDYHEEDQPTQSSEPVQIENLVRQAVPSRIYSSSWSNNIPGTLGFGKRSKSPGQTGRRECGGKLILAMPILFPATEDISFQLKTFDEQLHVQVYAIL